MTTSTDRIAEALRRVDEVGPDEAVYRRAQAGPRDGEPPREPGGRARLVAGVTAFAVFAAAALFAWNAFRPETRSEGPPKPRPTPTDIAPITTIDGWQVEVSVTPQHVGPIAISVGPAEPAGADDKPWFQHDLVLENIGDSTVTFANTPTSTFLDSAGRHRLLASDDLCGSEIVTQEGVHPGACAMGLAATSLEPGHSVKRTISLYRSLPGMGQLRSGTYILSRELRFGAWAGLGTRTIQISYRITETPDAAVTVPACVTSDLRIGPARSLGEPMPPRPYGIGILVTIESRNGMSCRVDTHLTLQIRNGVGTVYPVSGHPSIHLAGVVRGRAAPDPGISDGWRLGDWCPTLPNLPFSVALYLDGRFVRVDRVKELDSCTEHPNIAQGGPRRRGTGSPYITPIPG